MQWGSVAEWVGALGSFIAGIGALFAALVALRIASNAHKAKLNGNCKIVDLYFIPEDGFKFSTISLKMTNTGPHPMIIRYIEMWVGKKQAKQGEQGEFNAVKSWKESEPIPPDNTFGFIKPPDILYPEPSDILEVGKSCIRLIPCNFGWDEKGARASLKEFVRNKKEAKTVRFAVYTDYGRFFLKSEKCVVKAIIDATTQKH